MPSLWVTNAAGQLVPLESSGYASEKEFQQLLADSPELLASALDPSAEHGGWLLIDRELAIRPDETDGGRWSLDHLFIDADGVPTLVEVKRSSDPRARREVAGQMLDYAASFPTDWGAERLRAQWEARVARQALDREAEMATFIDGSAFESEDEFWAGVQTKVAASRLRLLFVADRLSPTLIRIIEYLNTQMRETEVLGVEVARHGSEDASLVAYEPVVRGRTTAVARTKSPSSQARTLDDFEAVLGEAHGAQVVDAARLLITGAEKLGAAAIVGNSAESPLLLFKFVTAAGKRWPMGVNPRHGKVVLTLDYLKHHPPFDDEAARADLVRRFSETVGGHVQNAGNLNGRPWAHVKALTTPGVVDGLLALLGSAVDSATEQ
jgi:hypothetical protein